MHIDIYIWEAQSEPADAEVSETQSEAVGYRGKHNLKQLVTEENTIWGSRLERKTQSEAVGYREKHNLRQSVTEEENET